MSKQLKFALSVDSTALLQANPREFYSKALLDDRSSKNFRQLVNVKEKTKIYDLEFGNVLQEADCDFVSSTASLTAITVEPCKFNIGVELCQFELESSFFADYLKPGSNNPDFAETSGIEPSFWAHYRDRLAQAVSDNLEYLTWRGNDAGSTGTYLDMCDGIIAQINAASASIPSNQKITATATITSANVITEMNKVYDNIPVILKEDEIIWYISTDIARAYRRAAALGNTLSYITKELDFTYLGIQLYEAKGMPARTMVASRKNNFGMVTDLVSDFDTFLNINMMNTTGDRKIRTISSIKYGLFITNPSEFVIYQP